MRSIAIIDLDTNRERGEARNKMVVNNSERARLAQEHASRFSQRDQTSAFFAKMFDPDLVARDVIEDQARDYIEHIEARGAMVLFLTSRPHIMQDATERWLDDHGLSRPCVFKNYGTGERGLDGKPDMGDRYVKTATWKARQVPRIIAEVELERCEPLDWVLFIDDEEVNRAAVAEIGDPRILLRCSLEDAATHDFQPREIEQGGAPFLRRLQELASLLEMREAFESAEKCQLTIEMPEIPGQVHQRHTSVLVEAWQAAAYAPGADPGQRFYRYNERYPQRNELSEIEQIISLQVACDQAGRVISLKTAKHGPALSLLAELEDAFDPDEPEHNQKYADEWVTHAIDEFGYVAAARAQRGMQLVGQPALDAYLAHVQAKNEEIKAALYTHRDPDQTQDQAHE